MTIDEYVLLKDFTTFKIGGAARFFCRARSKEDLIEAVRFSREKKISFVVLGGGSNVLVSDTGFDGLIIKVEIGGVEFEETVGKIRAIVGAGENWDKFVEQTIENNLYGLENLSGIPGTVGAAPVQNIGAYGVEVKDLINWVEVLDAKNLEFKVLRNDDCRFGYRDSCFRTLAGKDYLISRVAFDLEKHGKLKLDYKDVKEFFKAHENPPSLSEVREAIIKIRSKKFPDLRKTGTAGSFFKNPIISETKFNELKVQYPDLPGFPVQSNALPRTELRSGTGVNGQMLMVKVSLAYILDKICGVKGLKQDSVGLHEAQPIVLVNFGGSTAKQVKELAEQVAEMVKAKTGIQVGWEVQLVD